LRRASGLSLSGQGLRRRQCMAPCLGLGTSITAPAKRFFAARRARPEDLVVSILGPPNAGKSTLFNRLLDKETNRMYRLASETSRGGGARSRERLSGTSRSAKRNPAGAIVSAIAGTTRDRRECIGRLGGTYFSLVDTAGVDGERMDHLHKQSGMMHDMMQQTLQAARQADLVFLMFDARVGVTSDLMETARWIRKVSSDRLSVLGERQIVLLANKLEGDHWSYDGSPVLEQLAEATRIGFGEVIPISAEHGEGMADLAGVIEKLTVAKRKALGLPDRDGDDEEDKEVDGEEKPLQLAILGRQNVGKSTLVNALLQQERVIAGAMPGLTRDSIAIEWSWNGRPVQLVDTAGIRKRSKRDHSDEIEDFAVQDAMRAMKLADAAVLVLDAGAGMINRQEMAIADTVLKEGRSLVIAANKMDLVLEEDYDKEDFADSVRTQLEARFPMLRKTPIVPMSSLMGESVQDLMPVVFNARDRWARMIPTGQLNRWLSEVLDTKRPPMVNGVPVRIKYILQTKGRPPTFLLFCNTDAIPESYVRFLLRNFQDTFEVSQLIDPINREPSTTHSPPSPPFTDRCSAWKSEWLSRSQPRGILTNPRKSIGVLG
jgi:GTP-binding protein